VESNFIAEYRLYRRDEKGKIIKENDHLLDCARYCILSGIDIAQFPPEYTTQTWPNASTAIHQSVYDPFSKDRIRSDIGGAKEQSYNPLDRKRY
jgi:hypothetical protein